MVPVDSLAIVACIAATALNALLYGVMRRARPVPIDERVSVMVFGSMLLVELSILVSIVAQDPATARAGQCTRTVATSLLVVALALHSRTILARAPRGVVAAACVLAALPMPILVAGAFFVPGLSGGAGHETRVSALGVVALVGQGLGFALPKLAFLTATRGGAVQIGARTPLILAGALALFVDALVQGGVLRMPYITPLALAALSVANVFMLAGDLLRTQRAEIDLETLVRQRTLELRRAQTDLVQAEKLASVGLIAAGVAHEINNPAAYVLANLTLMRETLFALRRQRQAFAIAAAGGRSELPTAAEASATDRLAEETLRDALDGLRRIRDIVADLRSLAQKDAQDPEPVRLAKVVETSAALARPTVRQRASLDLSLDRVPLVLGYASKLSQVIINLIVNAAEAMPEDDSRPGRIEVRTVALAQEVALEVRDNGRGIPAAQIGEIFRPLYTTKRSGTGLGLAICRRIVEEHGGRIEVESVVGEGTTFRVVLPQLVTVDLDRLADLDSGPFGALSPASATDALTATPSEGLAVPPIEGLAPAPPRTTDLDARKLVMIVDDEALLLKVLARFVGRRHRVAAAASVDDALRVLREGVTPEVILCDLMMPTRSGADLYVALQRERPELAARITFMSGGGTDERLNEFPRTVGRPTLVKPLEPDALLAYLDAQLACAAAD